MTVKELTKLLANFDPESKVEFTVEGDYDSETGAMEITSTINNVTIVIHEDFTATTHPDKYVVSYWKGERYVTNWPVQHKQFDTHQEAERFVGWMKRRHYQTAMAKSNATR